MKLYHQTTKEAAPVILAEGFRDASGSYMFSSLTLTGASETKTPVSIQDAPFSPVLLVVEIPLMRDELAEYAIAEEAFLVWEYLIPAAVLNKRGTVRLATPDEENE